jgi:hypothetical protein
MREARCFKDFGDFGEEISVNIVLLHESHVLGSKGNSFQTTARRSHSLVSRRMLPVSSGQRGDLLSSSLR